MPLERPWQGSWPASHWSVPSRMTDPLPLQTNGELAKLSILLEQRVDAFLNRRHTKHIHIKSREL